MPGRLPSFVVELQRRHVFRVGAAYVVGAAAVGGGASVFLEELAPDWVLPAVLWLLVLGLPLALALAWAYDITPQGIERSPSTPIEPGAAAADVSHFRAESSRLAVLPFANIHADRDQDYFADGMSVTQIGEELRVGSLGTLLLRG